MKKLAIWGKEGFTPQPGASFLLPDPTFEAEFCPKPSSSSSSRGLSRSSSRPKTAPTGPAHSAFSPFRKQSTDQNSPTTPPQPTAPEPILTLRLSSISFLDSVVHDGTSDNPLYVIETDANHTKIRRSDPKGFINVARVRWREDTNYFARSKKELNGIMLAFGKGQWKPADEFLGYSYSSLSSYLKFYLPHHPHSLRWKRVGSAYQCTTQTVKGPIAILESPYALAPPMLKIFDPIFPEDTSRLQHMHAGVPMSLLDFLLVTSMLLLTEHDEWTNITRASAPSSSHADRTSSSSAAEPLSSLSAEVSSLSISDASSARSAGVYSNPNSRSTPVTVPSPADHEPQDVPLPSSYPTSPPPHPIHRSRSRLSGLSHSASRTSLTSASTSAESAGLIRPRTSGGIERWRAAVHPPLPLPSPEIPDPVTRPASSRSRSSADSDQSSPLGSRFSHRVSSSLSHSAHTRELPMPPVPVPPLARPPPPPPPSVLDAPPARHGSLDSPMTRAPSSLPPLAVRSQTLPPPATSSGLTHAPPPTPARALPPVPIPQLQSPPRSQFQAQSQAPTPLPGKRSHVPPPPLPQTRNGGMSYQQQQQRVPGSEVRFKTPPVYEPAEESGRTAAAAASSGGVSIGVGAGVGVGIGGVGVDTVGAYDAPPPAYSQHDFERSPFGPGRAAAAGGGDV